MEGTAERPTCTRKKAICQQELGAGGRTGSGRSGFPRFRTPQVVRISVQVAHQRGFVRDFKEKPPKASFKPHCRVASPKCESKKCWRTQGERCILSYVDEGCKRVLAIVAGILVARHLKTTEDLFDNRGSPRTEAMVAAAVQWAERIMRKIDNVFPDGR